MPFTVITLSKTPKSLRGDLTKWMQEISTGVYIGNFNSKVREKLWQRVLENVGTGQATISFNTRNEIGYSFMTHNTKRKPIDSDGIPLVLIDNAYESSNQKLGFSDASKFRKAKKYRSRSTLPKINNLIFLDIETDGLDENRSNIIEIGAIRVGKITEEFHKLIKIDRPLAKEITKLTGIKDEDLEKGEELTNSLIDILDFLKSDDIIGYNIVFDIKFLNAKLQKLGQNKLSNKIYDLMHFVKKDNLFLQDYKLQTVLKSYGINKLQKHRALDDAKLCYELSNKVNKFKEFIKGR